ncbi:MAG: S1 RNA-binding domain-containing protein [Oscillospiraceae bacterium]|nr:S1 RNA-binding domain-containing protein [Oscillospiraceae bacterium]
MEFGVGAVLEGKVTGITKFGAFVSFPDGKTGLVHISEIAYTYVNDIRDHLKEGQMVQVKVLGIDDNNRINLSIKKALDPPRPANSRQAAGGGKPNAPRSQQRGSYVPKQAVSKEPITFEDRLKQFMQASDSKMSELNRHIDKRGGSRRGRR